VTKFYTYPELTPRTLIEKGPGAQHADVLIRAQVQQVLVAGHDCIGLDGERCGNDVIVVRIAAHAAGVRQRAENKAADLVQLGAPGVDLLVAVGIGVSQARIA